jgi:glycerol-3-phosphate O-acyltransferase / dihydroxyacetone phosphate acyltransferase
MIGSVREVVSASFPKVSSVLTKSIIPHIQLFSGGSHDRSDLLPLKAGVALMALGAMANNPGVQVKIVPVGLNYFHPHRFRSRAVVEFGTPLDVPTELVDQFSLGSTGRREASGKLLDMVFDALKTVTVRAPDYETLMVRTKMYSHGRS